MDQPTMSIGVVLVRLDPCQPRGVSYFTANSHADQPTGHFGRQYFIEIIGRTYLLTVAR